MSKQRSRKIYDAFIIGGGPAGLTAALYGARAGLKIAFIEKESPGGKLNKTLIIENYPGYLETDGPNLGEYILKQTSKLGIDSYEGNVVKVTKKEQTWKIQTEDKRTFKSKTVLVASGMKEKVLDIPNVKEYYGRGVSYCAICDGSLYKGKKVVVVGGGNSAAEESMYLSGVTGGVELVHRRREFRADEILVKQIKKNKNIKINTPYLPIEVKVKNNKVVGLIIEHAESKKRKTIKGDCVFFYVGLLPENHFLSSLKLNLDELGFIKVDENMHSSIPGLFAAGDVIHKHLRQVVTATNDGSIAAIAIKNYLNSLKK